MIASGIVPSPPADTPARRPVSDVGSARTATAIISAARKRCAACSCGVSAIRATGEGTTPRLRRVKLLLINPLTPISPLVTYREDCLTQDPAFVGLLSMVTGSTLQEEIAVTARQLLLRGRNILGFVGPETTRTTAHLCHDQQASVAASTAAPHSPELQLGGPSVGPP